jgi:hypothetical protein
MSRRLLVAAIVIWTMSPMFSHKANAQSLIPAVPTSVLLVAANDAASSDPATPIVAPDDQFGRQILRPTPRPRRGFSMLPFYVSTAALQMADAHSTMLVIKRGGGEANPLLQGVVNRKPAFIALKAGVAAATIYAVSKIAKGNKVAAMALSIGLNSLYATVVSHNYKLANSMR